MSSYLEEVLKKQTRSDRIIEIICKSAGKSISADSKYWIHTNIKELNLKVNPTECIMTDIKWIEEYPERCISIIQNNKIYKKVSNIDLNSEALIVIPDNMGDEEKNYILLYLPK